MASNEISRLAPVRRRVALAKRGFALAGALVFGSALGFSRINQPGHPKQHLRPLRALPRFVAGVRANQVDPGIIAHVLKSPDAATGQS
jgi:hypothetical protein